MKDRTFRSTREIRRRTTALDLVLLFVVFGVFVVLVIGIIRHVSHRKDSTHPEITSTPSNEGLSATLQALSTAIRNDVPSKTLREAFDDHVGNLLREWEKAATGAVTNEISTLKQGDALSCADSAGRLAKMGSQGRAAALSLAETMGNNRELLPGLLDAILGARTFSAGSRAGYALTTMDQAGALALIYAASHDFRDTDNTRTQYRKDLGRIYMEILANREFPDTDALIHWFTDSQDGRILAGTTESESRLKEVGCISGISSGNSDFLAALITGAIIYGMFHLVRRSINKPL